LKFGKFDYITPPHPQPHVLRLLAVRKGWLGWVVTSLILIVNFVFLGPRTYTADLRSIAFHTVHPIGVVVVSLFLDGRFGPEVKFPNFTPKPIVLSTS